MNQGKFHLLAILLIPIGMVLFFLIQIWILNMLFLLVAGTLVYFLFRKKNR